MVQCLIVLRFGLQLQGIGSSPLTKLISTDMIDLWSLLGPDLTMEGSLSTERPFFYNNSEVTGSTPVGCSSGHYDLGVVGERLSAAVMSIFLDGFKEL